MDDLPIAGRGEEGRIFNRVLGSYDAPAYVRRARAVQETLDAVLSQCRKQRDECLSLVRTRLALLRAHAGSWETLRPFVRDDDQLDILRRLEEELSPRLRAPASPTESPSVLLRDLRALVASLGRFNQRWLNYLVGVDLAAVNATRDGYNRYYLLEKECAVRSVRLARQGFHQLPPMTLDKLTRLLPPLPVPALGD